MGLVKLGGVARGELFGCFLGSSVSIALAVNTRKEPKCTCAIAKEC